MLTNVYSENTNVSIKCLQYPDRITSIYSVNKNNVGNFLQCDGTIVYGVVGSASTISNLTFSGCSCLIVQLRRKFWPEKKFHCLNPNACTRKI